MLRNLLLLIFAIASPFIITAQVSTECPGSIAPTLDELDADLICSGSATINLVTASNLPTTEFVLTDENTPADDAMGPAIVGTTTNTTFDPTSLGVTAGVTFKVTAVSYNLSQIQNLIDDLYNNTFFGIPCCTVADSGFPGVCDSLMNAGVNSGADIQDLQDALAVFNAINNTSGTSSINGLIAMLDDFNVQGASVPNACGGSSIPLCYAVDQSPASTTLFTYLPMPSIDMIADGCPTAPETVTVTASVAPGGDLEYSSDGITYQMSNVLTVATFPATIFVQETTCGQVSSEVFSASCALPVVLTYFNGTEKNGEHLINWAIESSENFDYFSLQKSVDGNSFGTIYEIANDEKSGTATYEYLEKTPTKGLNYYRLKMTDLDGTFSYSKKITLSLEEDGTIALYPNPAKEKISIALDITNQSKAAISVFDNTGKLILSDLFNLENGLNEKTIATANWNAGLYFIEIQFENRIVVKKFIVQP